MPDPRPRRSSVRMALLLPREPVRVEMRRPEALAPADLDAIWRVTERYVETERALYEKKLRAIPEVGVFRTVSGDVVGVTSFETYPVTWAGGTRTVVYTSNVVVDERYRRQNLPLRLGARVFLRERLRHPLRPIDWLFDTFSFRSYVLLPRNFGEFWPRRDASPPAPVRAYIDHLARPRYGDAWVPERGVVRSAGTKRLRAGTAPIGPRELADPDVRFFAGANPGHAEGDMLVCLCPLTLANWAFVARGYSRRRREVAARGRRMRASGAFRVPS